MVSPTSQGSDRVRAQLQGPPQALPAQPVQHPEGVHAATPGVAWPGGHPHGMRGAYGAMPAAEASHAGGGAGWGAPPPDVAGVAAAPEAMPFDMLSFPAGLIPKLVKHSLKCGTCQPRPLVATIESQCCTILHWTTSSCCWPHLQCKMTQPSHSVASMHSICNACAQCEIEIFCCRYEKEYTPLLPEDIEKEPPPRRPQRDGYLQSRLSRFYAEVAQYQPGVDRAAYEAKLHALGGGLLPPPPEQCAATRCCICIAVVCATAVHAVGTSTRILIRRALATWRNSVNVSWSDWQA